MEAEASQIYTSNKGVFFGGGGGGGGVGVFGFVLCVFFFLQRG